MQFVARHLKPKIDEALDNFRVVVLHGARQCGKSTLAQVVANQREGTYASLDDDTTRQAALADPQGFLLDQAHPLVVDEIQLGGNRVVRAIKQVVDADPTPGRFLLTGSTNFLTVPTISESLAGRVRLLRLWPLSQAEYNQTDPFRVESWFGLSNAVPNRPRLTNKTKSSRHDYMEIICRGGYPEAMELPRGLQRDWFESYIDTVIERDVFALGDLRQRSVLPTLVEWVAASTANELNIQSTASRLGIDRATLGAYLAWMETVFLVHRLPSWSRNPSARPVRRPKIHITDTGLATALLGLDADALTVPTAPATGHMLETFIVNEIARLAAPSTNRLRLHHFRDHQGHEVDLIIERSDGAIVAVEIKATSSPAIDQLRHVAWLRDRLDSISPGTFRAGILLHTGNQEFTIGDRLRTCPINTLWR